MLEPGTEEERQEASSIRYVVGLRLALLTSGRVAVYDGRELVAVAYPADLMDELQPLLLDEALQRERRWARYELALMEPKGEGPSQGPQLAKVSIDDTGGL